MISEPVPDVVFKYTKAIHALKILQNCEIKITSPAELNDPFEFEPYFDSTFRDEDLKRLLLSPQFAGGMRVQCGLTCAEFRKRVREDPSAFKSSFLEGVPFLIEGARAAMKKHSQDCAVFCVSGTPTGVLLWAHYGDEHKGVAVGFGSDGWRENRAGFLKVRYSERRPVIDVASIEEAWRSPSNIFRTAASTKSLEWAYEEEYRMVFDCTNGRTSFDASRSLHLSKIHCSQICQVVLGARISVEDEQSVRGFLAKPEWSHVVLKRARLSHHCFAVEVAEA